MRRNTLFCKECGNDDFIVSISLGGQIRLGCQYCGLLTEIALCLSDIGAYRTLLVNSMEEKNLFDEESVRQVTQDEIYQLRYRHFIKKPPLKEEDF